MILKWHIEQNALESSQYSLTHFMVVGLIEGLGDDVDVPGVLNLFVSDSTELVGWPSIISLPTLIILPPPPRLLTSAMLATFLSGMTLENAHILESVKILDPVKAG